MKIKIDTTPWRITTYFQREVSSRRKTNTYNYHKRKWHEKVTSNSKTGTKTPNIYYFNWWARSTGLSSVFWFNSPHYYDGSVFRCFIDPLYFWGITGNNYLTSATKHRKFKRLMRGMKQFVCFCLVTFLGHFSRSGGKSIALKGFASKYILAQSNRLLFLCLPYSLCVLFF